MWGGVGWVGVGWAGLAWAGLGWHTLPHLSLSKHLPLTLSPFPPSSLLPPRGEGGEGGRGGGHTLLVVCPLLVS